MRPRLAVLVALGSLACGGGPGPGKAAPQSPQQALADFMAAVKKNKRAHATYEAFSPSHQREYFEWIVDAKTDETRARRVAQAVEWMAEGKPRNWKYMR